MLDIGSGSFYSYYCKLPDKSESKIIKSVKYDTFNIILDLAKFSQRVFKVLTISKNIDKKL